MSDNSRKFLWLAVAVSVFTLVVLGAAFLIFSIPKSSGQAPFSLGRKAEPRTEEPGDYLADLPSETPAAETTGTTSAGDIVIVYGNDPNSQTSGTQPSAPSTTTIIVAPPAAPSSSPVPSPAPATPATSPKDSKAPVATKSPTPSSGAVPAIKTTPPAATPATTAAKTTPKAAPQPPAATTAPAATATAAKTATSPAGDFWIQAGSFSVKENADSLKATIQGKSLPAVVGVKDINGKSYYTVKIGPYHSREEATKWLSAVKAVEGAGKSFVTQ